MYGVLRYLHRARREAMLVCLSGVLGLVEVLDCAVNKDTRWLGKTAGEYRVCGSYFHDTAEFRGEKVVVLRTVLSNYCLYGPIVKVNVGYREQIEFGLKSARISLSDTGLKWTCVSDSCRYSLELMTEVLGP